jgi:hypothetical protein
MGVVVGVADTGADGVERVATVCMGVLAVKRSMAQAPQPALERDKR